MQDGKNLILAIFLCLVVIVGWSYLAEYMGWVQKPDPAVVAQQQAQQQSRHRRPSHRRKLLRRLRCPPLFLRRGGI